MCSIACQAPLVKYFLSGTDKKSKIQFNSLELNIYLAYGLDVVIIPATNHHHDHDHRRSFYARRLPQVEPEVCGIDS
jgi:hypothetical protein